MSSEHEEPDYRFTLANERTFLAWIRTALALVAGGMPSYSSCRPSESPGSDTASASR